MLGPSGICSSCFSTCLWAFSTSWLSLLVESHSLNPKPKSLNCVCVCEYTGMSSFGSARIARKSIVIESVPAQVRVILGLCWGYILV